MAIFTRYWGFWGGALLAMLILSQFGLIGVSTRDRSPSAEKSQFERDIGVALETLRAASTYRDWMLSGYTPNDVITSTLALKRADANASLCAALKNLSGEDLSVFEIALNSPAAKKDLFCSHELIEKVAKYWMSQTEAADSTRGSGNVEPISMGAKRIKPESIRDVSADLLETGEYAIVFRGNIDPLVTREILKVLEERNVKAHFLIPGTSARDHADIVEMMSRTGDVLGSEGSDLRDLTLLPTLDAERAMVEGQYAVEVAGRTHKPSLFSFPFGASTPTLEMLASRKGLKPVRPSFNSDDWKTPNAMHLVENFRKRLASTPKGILLFHNFRQTAIALPLILDEMAANHKRIVTFEIK